MMATLKSSLKKISLARYVHARVRGLHDRYEGSKLFANPDLYVQALYRKGAGPVVLRTHDGLNLTIRQNLWDARIVREIFFDKPYDRHFHLPFQPTIVDIGGYIGDFSVYAAKYLKARRVVVYEPIAENFEILKRNVDGNGFGDRITAVNKAVGNVDELVLNVQKKENDEVHVSAYWYPEAERRRIPCITLPDLLETHQLESVDLLKVDCEGGEYEIFPSVPDRVFDRIRNIVFEYHRVEGFEEKLARVLSRLESAGYALRRDKGVVSAVRPH